MLNFYFAKKFACVRFSVGLALLLLTTAVCGAQTNPASLLKGSDLQADAAILRHAYESLHPGFYRYNSVAQMSADFAELNQRLGHDQTLQDAFLAFSEFAAKVRCGHTQANPFNQTRAVTEALLQTPTRVPFYFQWLDKQMIVTQDFTPGHVLPAGTEIVEIDGVAASRILATLLPIARADGANDAKRIDTARRLR